MLFRSTIPRQTEVIEGSPAHVICEVARAQNLDLIVMNTHGRSGASHLLIGSVTERVVRNAPCSVWTFRKSPEPPARQGS